MPCCKPSGQKSLRALLEKDRQRRLPRQSELRDPLPHREVERLLAPKIPEDPESPRPDRTGHPHADAEGDQPNGPRNPQRDHREIA